ncbi:MAG: hypothetical protein WCG23_11455 [bacterium]
MSKTKLKEETIEKICYQSSGQSISYREIYKLNDKKIKLAIKSDSYTSQCYAKAFILKNDEWTDIYSIPYSLMKTPEGLAYRNECKNNRTNPEGIFKDDILKLKTNIEKIIF